MEGNRFYCDFSVIGRLLNKTEITIYFVLGFIIIVFNGVQSELLGQPLTAIRSANQYIQMSFGAQILNPP